MRSSTIISSLLLGALPSLTSAHDCSGIKAIGPRCSSHESAYHRDTFYIGGGYVDSGIPGQQMWSDQLYVEKLTPPDEITKPYPIVFLSAGVNTGAEWLNTPDNRKGWASYYLDQGYQVYIVDIAANGRSGQQLLSKYPLRRASLLQKTSTNTRRRTCIHSGPAMDPVETPFSTLSRPPMFPSLHRTWV
jgi:hypothetical protein